MLIVIQNNIVHWDIKPENILFESKNSRNVKVIDFGIAQKCQPPNKLNQPVGTSYYVAPEVLSENYDEKCDVWSIGVILYIMLSGVPPFAGDNVKEICNKVKEGKYLLTGENWEDVSSEAIDLIQKWMTVDPSKRISWVEALNHEWFKNEIIAETNATQTISALKNLQFYNAEKKLQQAVITFIVSQLASQEDLNELQKAFKALDRNKSGVLTKEDLLAGYKDLLGDEAEAEVDRIMSIADIDRSGAIDYTEWVVATIDK